ncbi:hypothetical protein EVAR_17275_1 [Eumeta japonica]|uniref:Uncharacterized protein n=1 Tax=Eumeta variegata TaxID=151549 RepID=A0A4C1TT06_EUMVA|nr:hypothetical protein EVAR_17275_1 [Eumeta japonica]
MSPFVAREAARSYRPIEVILNSPGRNVNRNAFARLVLSVRILSDRSDADRRRSYVGEERAARGSGGGSGRGGRSSSLLKTARRHFHLTSLPHLRGSGARLHPSPSACGHYRTPVPLRPDTN